jgi:hypothetical protein
MRECRERMDALERPPQAGEGADTHIYVSSWQGGLNIFQGAWKLSLVVSVVCLQRSLFRRTTATQRAFTIDLKMALEC